MDNPFSYPSLAFGAEAMQIGKELGRYNSFKTETETETEPLNTESETDPAIPTTDTTDTPPKGGQEVGKTWTPIEIVASGAFLALIILTAASYDYESNTFNILPNVQF